MKNQKSVLIVDDQETNITMLQKILAPEYTVYTAENGAEGVKLAEKHLPDVILLDVIMDEMDGYAVIEILKSTESTKEIPVIFVTTLDSIGDEAWGLSLGAADYITKPLSPAIVKLRIANQMKMLDQLRTIERLYMFDPLTELPNRRNLIHRIKVEWERTIKKNKPFNILIIDIDDFKSYNNIYGHEQGDAALQAIAGVLVGAFKNPQDFAARWGGEEFVMLLPNVDAEQALGTAEYIRKSVEDLAVSVQGGRETKVSVSIGVNSNREWWDGATIDEFIKEAYTVLFEAKDNGGNQICHNQKEGHNSV
jgi:diguanylate cyclase (GGDEF)-like protein